MKKAIRRWLGIDQDQHFVRKNVNACYEEIVELEDRLQTLRQDFEANHRILRALLDYLKVKRVNVEEPDPNYPPPQPRMHTVTRIERIK